MAQTVDPKQFGACDVAGQPLGMDFLGDDGVRIPCQNDGGSGDLMISWRHGCDIGIEAGDIGGVGAEGGGTQDEFGAGVPHIGVRPPIGRKNLPGGGDNDGERRWHDRQPAEQGTDHRHFGNVIIPGDPAGPGMGGCRK
ncbi:hypothetical protein D3C87_1487680 [compost metagenome]